MPTINETPLTRAATQMSTEVIPGPETNLSAVGSCLSTPI